MVNFIQVGKTSELQEGTMKEVQTQGLKLLLARAGNKYYAADNRCPHMGGKLSQGKLDGTVVTCPRHGSQFDLRDGQVIRWLKGSGLASTVGKVLKAPKKLNTYNVKVEDDRILIKV